MLYTDKDQAYDFVLGKDFANSKAILKLREEMNLRTFSIFDFGYKVEKDYGGTIMWNQVKQSYVLRFYDERKYFEFVLKF